MTCLERGDVDTILKERAERLENAAQSARGFVGNLAVPSCEDWKAAVCEYDEESAEVLRKINKVRRKRDKAQRELEKLWSDPAFDGFDDDIPF